jgi:hypothetical protein
MEEIHIHRLLDTKQVVASLTFEQGFPSLHLTLPNGLTPSLYKYLKKEFLEDLLITLGMFGFETLFAVLRTKDKVGIKSAKALGFEEELVKHGLMILAMDII